jgi:hypothetical protein
MEEKVKLMEIVTEIYGFFHKHWEQHGIWEWDSKFHPSILQLIQNPTTSLGYLLMLNICNNTNLSHVQNTNLWLPFHCCAIYQTADLTTEMNDRQQFFFLWPHWCANHTETCQVRNIIKGCALNYVFKNSMLTLFMHRNSCSHSLFVCKVDYVAHTLSIVDVGAYLLMEEMQTFIFP